MKRKQPRQRKLRKCERGVKTKSMKTAYYRKPSNNGYHRGYVFDTFAESIATFAYLSGVK